MKVKVLHTAHSIQDQILSVLPKFELIWMKTEIAQALQSLYGNYYWKIKQSIQPAIVFAYALLIVRAMLKLLDTFISYNFAEDEDRIAIGRLRN